MAGTVQPPTGCMLAHESLQVRPAAHHLHSIMLLLPLMVIVVRLSLAMHCVILAWSSPRSCCAAVPNVTAAPLDYNNFLALR